MKLTRIIHPKSLHPPFGHALNIRMLSCPTYYHTHTHSGSEDRVVGSGENQMGGQDSTMIRVV
jgi:hypothetical protein